MRKYQKNTETLSARRPICDTLLELLDEKPLDKITVTDIAYRADISRGTFYLHDDCVRAVLNELEDACFSRTVECLRFIYQQQPEKICCCLSITRTAPQIRSVRCGSDPCHGQYGTGSADPAGAETRSLRFLNLLWKRCVTIKQPSDFFFRNQTA